MVKPVFWVCQMVWLFLRKNLSSVDTSVQDAATWVASVRIAHINNKVVESYGRRDYLRWGWTCSALLSFLQKVSGRICLSIAGVEVTSKRGSREQVAHFSIILRTVSKTSFLTNKRLCSFLSSNTAFLQKWLCSLPPPNKQFFDFTIARRL